MRVLIVSAYFETKRGGIEIVAGRLARGLAQEGAEVDWIASDASALPDLPAGIEAIPAPAWNGVERRIGVPVPVWGITALRRLWRAVGKADVLMIHDTLYLGNVSAFAAGWIRHRPVVVVQHVAPIGYAHPVLRMLMRSADLLVGRAMLRWADQVVFISGITAASYQQLALSRPARLVFNGVDTEVFRPVEGADRRASARTSVGLPAEGPVALFAGRLVERKGIHVVEAMARALPEVNYLVAGSGAIDPRCWGLPNVVHAEAASASEMARLYAAADLLILPSIGEGFPLVIQEALAAGLPVLCSEETAGADPCLAGMVATAPVDLADIPGTSRAWIARLKQALAKDRVQPEKARRERAAFAAARYGWDSAVATYIAVLQELTAQSR